MLLLLLFCAIILIWSTRKASNLRISSSTPYINSLLSAPRTSLLTRAIPNRRLVTAFSIDNSFTTASPYRHNAFMNQVKKLINLTPSDWFSASAYAHSILPPRTNTSLHLVPFVRSYVLTVILHLFFPQHAGKDEDIADLGILINELWLASKCGCPTPEQKQELTSTLSQIFPGTNLAGEENPLNLILPAYETLWRVVLRCFLEIHFRGRGGWRDGIVMYAQEPTAGRFTEVVGDKGEEESVEWLVMETLRLYPPTKRVYRSVEKFGATGPLGEVEEDLVEAADVEALHLKTGGWGRSAKEFRPSRWSGQERSIHPGQWIPFGAGKFVCPAKNTFAPRLIGILVGTLLEYVPKEARQEVMKAEDRVPNKGRLGNEREGYGSLILKWEKAEM